MEFNSFIPDILASLASTALISILAYYFGFKPVHKKLDTLEEKIIKYKLSSTNLLFDSYNEQIFDIRNKIKDLTSIIEDWEFPDENRAPRTQEEYYEELNVINTYKEERKELNRELDKKLRDLTDLIKSI